MIQLSDLIEGAKNCVDNVAKVKRGEKVLILADTTNDPDVINAYRIASELAGGEVSVLTLKSKIAGAGPDAILSEGYFVSWPDIAWYGMIHSDVCLNLSGYIEVHSLFGCASEHVKKFMDLRKNYGTRLVRVQIAVKETLASAYAKFPEPLLQFIGAQAYKQVFEATNNNTGKADVKLTDPQGTDLACKGFGFITDWRFEGEKEATTPWWDFGSYNVGLQPALPTPNANGVIVSTALHTGPVPEMKITVKNGRGVHIEGGGVAGNNWLKDWKKNKHITSKGRAFSEHKEPGIDWLEEIMYATHPKAFMVGRRYMYLGAEADHGWFTGSRRAGTLHMAFGGGVGQEYKHRDVEIFFPTLIINKTTIIDAGRLTVLDSKEVRKEAKKYGDPDQILSYDWIPELPLLG
jgi:hypothetical protein